MGFYNYLQKNLNVVEVIGNETKLFKEGGNYKCLCPFHNDRHPSLFVSQKKNIWKCFSCNLGGDSIKFIELFKKLNRIDALDYLQRKYSLDNDELKKYIGKNIDYEFEKKEHLKTVIHSVVSIANSNIANLKNNDEFFEEKKKVINYLKLRGIDEEIIKKYQIGYNNKNGLFSFHLADWNANELISDCIKVGITNSNRQDIFNGRIIFPIKNFKNQTVGIIGRNIDNDEPKYLISKNSDIFEKSKSFFGQIQNPNQPLYICEGVFDQITLSEQFNKNNCVSFLGTNISEEQIKFIKYDKNIDAVVIVPDNDEAGLNAVDINAKKLLKNGLSVYVAQFENGKDINEAVTKEIGNDKLVELKEIPYNSWKLKQEIFKFEKNENELSNAEKTALLKNAIQRINDWAYDGYTISDDIKELSKFKGIEEKMIIKQIRALSENSNYQKWHNFNQKLLFENQALKEMINDLKKSNETLENANLDQAKILTQKLSWEEMVEIDKTKNKLTTEIKKQQTKIRS